MDADVVLFGDSHLTPTLAGGVRKLDVRLAESGLTVENLAVAGLTTRAALAMFDRIPPGPVVISLGGNDAAPWKRVPLPEFHRSYERILGMCSGPIVALGTSPVKEPRAWPRMNRRLLRYSKTVEVCATGARGSFIDMQKLLAGRPDVLLRDGVHLTDTAYAAIAQEVLSCLHFASKGNLAGTSPQT